MIPSRAVLDDEALLASINDVQRRAYHEAGHAVVGHALGLVITRISLVGQPHTGAASRDFWHHDLDAIGREVAFSFAGYLAERRAMPEDRARAIAGAGEDFSIVESFNPFCASGSRLEVTRMVLGSPARWLVLARGAVRQARGILVREWASVEDVVDELLESEVLEGRALRRVLRGVSMESKRPGHPFGHRATPTS